MQRAAKGTIRPNKVTKSSRTQIVKDPLNAAEEFRQQLNGNSRRNHELAKERELVEQQMLAWLASLMWHAEL